MNRHTQEIASNEVGSATMSNHAKRRISGNLVKLGNAKAISSNCAQAVKTKQGQNFNFAGIAG